MRRLTNTILFLALTALAAAAQDFKLYYAKNVSDVTQFSDNVDELAKQLEWKEVANNAIDGNQMEVYELKQMFASTRMKDLPDQQLFWRMRDHTLLCFRINDGSGRTGSYNVEVNYGSNADGEPVTRSLTTSRYFFANVPMETKEMTVKVWKNSTPIIFRYSLYDWDDQNLYLFQLDQKRQSTGDTYKMEYVTSYADADGEMQVQTNTLELQATKFQSFYLPEGHTLTDVFFLSGNKEEGDVKMRINLADIHPGVDLDRRFDIPRLTTKFILDKHENREMVNFNWLGTGLFEKYDTLYLKLFDADGNVIDYADIHVHRVDGQGRKVNDSKLTYLGYDEESEQHQILTYGHPAYIEILAPGCLPTLFRYKGAADAGSKIVSEDLCSAKLTLRESDVSDGDIAISEQHLRQLHDMGIVVARKGTDYVVCDVLEFDLASKLPIDTLCYMDNAGNDYPKIYNNNPTDRLAQMEVVFSSPKSNVPAAPTCSITATELKSHQQHVATDQEVTVVAASEFTNFKRDYYFVRLSLVDVVPRNTPCSLTLTTPSTSYSSFPIMFNAWLDPDQQKEEAEKKSEEMTTPPDNTKDVAKANGEAQLGFAFPTTFKFSLGPMKMKTGLTMDFSKQTINMFVSGAYTYQNSDEDKPYLSKARENAKNLQNYNYQKMQTNPNSKGQSKEVDGSLTDIKLKYEDWVLKESASIFDVTAPHVGFYFGGGFKLALQTPMTDFSRFQLQELSGFVEGGAGIVWTPDATGGTLGKVVDLLKTVRLVPDIGFVFDTNLRFDFGVKSFDPKMEHSMDWKNFGPFANLTRSTRHGAWMTVRTRKSALGSLQFGFRGGVKGAIQGGVAFPMDFSKFGGGGRLMLLGIAEAFVDVHAVIFHFSASAYGRVGKQWLWPDNDHNPFHQKFPYWLHSSTRTVGNSFRTLRAPEPSALGTALITDVAVNANPHFLDDGRVVYNNLNLPKNYNDDQVTLLDIAQNTTTTLSAVGTSASQHARSKRGQHEVVVWQQLTQTVNNNEVTDANSVAINNELVKHTQIKAVVRQADGTWKPSDVTPDDGYTDQQPVVTIQDDGKAACIYQHGLMKLIDETESPDSAMNHHLVGQLMLRTYDGNTWSEPTRLFDIDPTHQPTYYDLFMRGDTVLVGMSMTNEDFSRSYFQYASKPLHSSVVSYVDEELNPSSFFMNRVGRHAVIAMVYERPDSTHEAYVKTLSMDGHPDGHAGCDLGLSQSTPSRVKINCDRSDDDTSDFAVLWTETNNIVRDPAEGNTANNNMGTVLNASRIHLSSTPAVTYPLTVGGDFTNESSNTNLFLTDFDGHLSDDRINVVYTLSDAKSGGAIIMHNEKYFTNSFESDVTYTREALLGSSELPVYVIIRNTGTSAIKSATVTINGQAISIADSFVPPLAQKVFTVQYPIPENFDGYMASNVEVEYANVFKSRVQKGRRGAPARNLLRQSKGFDAEHIAIGDIDCNVVNRQVDDNGTNTFTVELIDRSSRGLIPGTVVLVGVFLHPMMTETLTGESQTIVLAENFHQMGGVRKAYAKVRVHGITEPVAAYIVPHIADLTSDEEGIEVIKNIRASRNAPYVNLFPSADPTKIVRPTLSKEPQGHRVIVKQEADGIRLTQLGDGQEVRLFTALGIPVYIGKADNNVFIPLGNSHGVYILSAGGEVFKFNY